MKRTVLIGLSVLALCVSSTAWGQVTIPNTFTSGSPAYAAEVNENFQTVVDALNAVTSGSSLTQVGSTYGMPYGTAATPANRNVWIYRSQDGLTYNVWLRYLNGTILVDGSTSTPFAYVEEYLSVVTSDGTSVSSIGGSRRGTNDATSAALRVYQQDVPNFLTDGSFITASGSARLAWVNFQITQSYLNIPFPSGNITFLNSTSNEITSISDRTRLFTPYPGALTINGISFATGNLLSFDPTSGPRIYAPNVGIVVINNGTMSLIYARRNGVVTGLLTGTPFASAAALDGVFF